MQPLTRLLLCAGLIISLAMGIRHGFGLFLSPMSADFGFSRETFAFALGLQNLLWGLSQPLTGALADRFGAVKVLATGGALYALGLVMMTVSNSGWLLSGSAGLMLGLALSGTTYSVIFGVIGRVVPAEQRAKAMGLASTAGSFGQFLMVPVEQQLIGQFGWSTSLLILALMSLLIIPAARGLREPAQPAGSTPKQSVRCAAREAFAHPSFQLLMAGYFVCGFQVVFIGVHLPSYLKDFGLPADVAATGLALIGLFNVLGSYILGQAGVHLSKKYLLSFIYLGRAIAIAAFISLPLSSMSVWVFASVMGFLWLATVPLTNGLIATMFGVQHLGLLSGLVFFSHQLGSFLGVWMGGYLYDRSGSYDLVWYIAIGLGVFAALMNALVREQAVSRVAVVGT